MYCGDETGAFIGDVGSSTARFGYGGEDHPKHVIPSYLSGEHTIPSSCYKYHDDLKSVYRMASNSGCDATTKSTNVGNPIVDPTEFLQQGDMVQDWDAMEEVWQNGFDVLRVRDRFKHTKGGGAFERRKKSASTTSSSTIRATDPGVDERCVHPILAVRSGCTHVVNSDGGVMGDVTSQHRRELEKYTELLFEALQVDSCFIAPSPMLAAFSHGRQTCLVVDIGASGCRVTPVVDGLLLKNAQRRSGRGGDWLGNVAWKAMLEEKIAVVPRYQLRKDYDKTKSSPLFAQWAMRDLMFEFRTSEHISLETWRQGDYTTPFMSKATDPSQIEEEKSDSSAFYELPDGTMINLETNIGRDLKRLPELLFTDQVPFVSEPDPNKVLEQSTTFSNSPVHVLMHESLGAVGDADLRKELCGNIVLVGGSSLLPNMEQRLSYELSTLISGNYKCKVVASKFSVERAHAPWIGGSILTSLGSFQQLWLSRKEYDEFGASLAIQRFP